MTFFSNIRLWDWLETFNKESITTTKKSCEAWIYWSYHYNKGGFFAWGDRGHLQGIDQTGRTPHGCLTRLSLFGSSTMYLGNWVYTCLELTISGKWMVAVIAFKAPLFLMNWIYIFIQGTLFENFEHWAHSKSLVPPWTTFMCLYKLHLSPNFFEHLPHWKSLNPSWDIFLCLCKESLHP